MSDHSFELKGSLFPLSVLYCQDFSVAGLRSQLQQKLAQLPQMKQAQQQKIQGRKTLLSLPRDAYSGRYLHPQLGEMTVGLNAQQQLEFRWGALHAIATGFDQPDTLRLELVPNSGDVLTFAVENGTVQQLTFSGMTFIKQR